MERTVLIYVEGTVQGVFFRKCTLQKAQSLGLRGSVENIKDGRVKIIAQGIDHRIQELIDWAKIGSPAANVKDTYCEIYMAEPFKGFEIIR